VWLLRRPLVRQVDALTWQLFGWVVFVTRYGVHAVPPEYVTDFASVPRLLWPVVPPYGTYTDAAIVHDRLITHDLPAGRIASPEVDEVFRLAMAALGVGFVRRWLMWAGVRWAAVANPLRRPGWLRTLPLLLAVSAAALAPVGLAVSVIMMYL
jgi:hypothetical protein